MLVMVVGALLNGVSCTSNPPKPAPPNPVTGMGGTLLLTFGPQNRELALYPLPKGPSRRVAIPPAAQAGWTGGFFRPGSLGGRVYILAASPAQLYELDTDGRPKALGKPLPPSSVLTAQAGEVVLAATCSSTSRDLWSFDLSKPSRWMRVAAGCDAALSPDGRRIAFVPTRFGHDIWGASLDGGGARRLLDLSAMPRLAAVGVSDPRIYGLAYGSQGIALAVGDGVDTPSRFAIVALLGARVAVVPLGPAFPARLSWSPSGDILAFEDCVHCSGYNNPDRSMDVRLWDRAQGLLRQVNVGTVELTQEAAVPLGPIPGMAWSPDGSLLAVPRGPGLVTVVDVRHATTTVVAVEGHPLGWGGG